MRIILILLLLLFGFCQPVFALYDPRTVPNNKYGIHLADTNDIADAAELVNSTGGDWGYMTIVIHETDRDVGKWQEIFNQLRRRKIIPLVRLATHVDRGGWAVPRETTFNEWVDFLNKLNWVVENRYVILFNEPNHGGEWGGTLNPEEYANVLVTLGRKLKESNPDFFILPAGLDVSAASDGKSLDAAVYLKRMLAAEPDIVNVIDGWASHSYPNPGFSASPYATGRGSLQSYLWELSLLRQHGLNRDLPVFITETGWLHSQGKNYNPRLLSTQTVSNYLEVAAENVWSDPDVVAVTPFIFSFQDEPFDHFSFKQFRSSEFYPHFYAYKNLPKDAGKPRQHVSFDLQKPVVTSPLVADSTYTLIGLLKNTGQYILPGDSRLEMHIDGAPEGFSAIGEPIRRLEPLEGTEPAIHLTTPLKPGKYAYTVTLVSPDISYELQKGELEIIPPPTLEIHLQLAWKRFSSTNDATVLVYDERETMIHKFTGVEFENGVGGVRDLRGVVPDHPYRIVVLVPQYLPRQVISTITADQTIVTVERLLPLDLDANGTLSVNDLLTAARMGLARILPLFFN